MTEDKKTTEQVSVTPPEKRNPTGKGGFGDNPQNRNPGGWDKEGSISYQYNKLMRLTPDELQVYEPETVAQEIAKQRLLDAKKSLPDAKEITDRTEGKAPQQIDLTTKGEGLNPFGQLDADDLRKLAHGA